MFASQKSMTTSNGFSFQRYWKGVVKVQCTSWVGGAESVGDHFLYGGEGGVDTHVQSVLKVVPGVVLLGLKQ